LVNAARAISIRLVPALGDAVAWVEDSDATDDASTAETTVLPCVDESVVCADVARLSPVLLSADGVAVVDPMPSRRAETPVAAAPSINRLSTSAPLLAGVREEVTECVRVECEAALATPGPSPPLGTCLPIRAASAVSIRLSVTPLEVVDVDVDVDIDVLTSLPPAVDGTVRVTGGSSSTTYGFVGVAQFGNRSVGAQHISKALCEHDAVLTPCVMD
jgi:hypothetical protein